MNTQSNPDYTINLQASDDTETLYYKVAVTDSKDKVVAGFVHETENYNEALIYAKSFFDTLAKGHIVIACYIEQPGRLAGQGALYSIGQFATKPAEIISDAELYDGIAEEFIEHCRRAPSPDVNVIFRKLVTRHKLDFYKEGKLLKHLQKLNLLEITGNSDEYWVEEV